MSQYTLAHFLEKSHKVKDEVTVSKKAVLRIRMDPFHWAGSTSGNVYPDPDSKKNCDKFKYESTKIIKI